jgi:hypothetical protein
MADNFSIDHPRQFDPKDPGGTSVAAGHCLAFGSNPYQPGEVGGVLRDRNRSRVWQAKVLPARDHLWIVIFEDVPPGEGYELEIHKVPGKEVLGRVAPVSVRAPHFSLSVGYPLSGAAVPQNFAAHGNTNEISTVSGTMTLQGGNSYNGQSVHQPSPQEQYWVLQFGVAVGNPYTLNVSNLNGTQATPSTGITAN